MGRPLSYAWYRFRSTWRSDSSYLVTVALLVAALGGLSMGAIAAARSTESSFARYAAASHVPQLFVLDGVINPAIGLDSGYNPALLRTLSHLPHVERVESQVELNMGPLSPGNHPLPTSSLDAEASVGGLGYNEDPPAITEGRMPDPAKADEFVMDAAAARSFGYHVGQRIRMGWVTNQQTTSGNLSPNYVVPPAQRATFTLVGVGGGEATSLFQDQDSASSQSSTMLFSPAFTDRYLACCSNDMESALTLRGGDRYANAVEREVKHVLPAGLPFVYEESRQVLATADATLRPEVIALTVFGAIAGAAALLICGQVVSRRIRLRAGELDVVRSLGADPAMTFWDGLPGTIGAVVLGCAGAVVAALALSPLAPLGPVRPYLAVDVHPDWVVLGFGSGALLLALAFVASLASLRARPAIGRTRDVRVPSSRVTSAATRAGLPVSAVAGVRFALEPGAGRSAVPVRSALLGAVLAVTVVVATVTFGSSLHTLVSHPALYGWNWTYDMDGGGGLGDIPAHQAATLLDADPVVQSWTGVYFSTLELDGLNVPVLGTAPHAAIEPPLSSGHALDSTRQVVLGTATLAQLHKRVGDTVVVRAQRGAPVTLTIAGTATLPPIGVIGSSHLEMGTGAVLDYHLIPAADRDLFEGTPGPNAILVRTRGGQSAQALHSIQAIGDKVDIAINGGSVLPVQRPAQIINYGSLGSTPVFLGVALAAGAAAALGITLVTSVRRRRRDLAILKTLGFTRNQLAATIAVQASFAAVIGCVVGIPVGIAAGRVLWDLFAGQIDAIAYPTVPAGTVTLIGVLAVVLAVLVATVPGRLAATTRTSQLLRAE
ncbi:MAG TPA: FtsX-like permease family protein [Acidimicrobiales bacterium]|nr:FtsX-like permease family protein [Acidimicrobiales bacterium]